MAEGSLVRGLYLLLLTAAFAVSASAQPVITNPGFETGDMAGWTYYGAYWSSNRYPWFAQILAPEGIHYAGMSRASEPAVDTGMYQQVSGATVGVEYSLVAWTNLFWEGGWHEDGCGRDSAVRLGIDPWGGTDPDGAGVVWSLDRYATVESTATWDDMAVSAVARSSTITVFAECTAVSYAAIIAACFDDFELYAGPNHAQCPSFRPPVYSSIGLTGLDDVAVLDLDGDADLDVAVTSRDAGVVSLQYNNGHGALTAAVELPAGGTPHKMVVADFNLDGLLDLAVSVDPSFIHCFLGNGTGLDPYIASPSLSGPLGMAVGDFDANGAPDLAVANSASNWVTVHLGQGNGAFAKVTDLPSSEYPHTVVCDIIDGDAVPDLACMSGGGPPLRTYSGKITPPYFWYNASASIGLGPNTLTMADLDDDGDSDFIMTDLGLLWDPRSEVVVLPGTGTWQLGTETTSYQLSYDMVPKCATVADINVDGDLDVSVACLMGDRVSVLIGMGAGALPSRYDVDVYDAPSVVRVADMNGDNLDDLVALCVDNHKVAVVKNSVPVVQSPEGWLDTGWNLISVPRVTEDMSVGVVLDALVPPNVLDNAVYSYDGGSGYSVYPGDFGQFEMFRGYWVYLTEGGRAVAYGTAELANRSTSLAQGWNLVGHPQDWPVPLASCSVRLGAQTESFDDAVAAGWIDGLVYGYDGGYFTVSTSGGSDAYLRPWRGYWVLANVSGLTLNVPAL